MSLANIRKKAKRKQPSRLILKGIWDLVKLILQLKPVILFFKI